jgi:hypothetical protein
MQRYGKTVTSIDKDGRLVSFSDGTSLSYTSLLSTLPLDQVLTWTGGHCCCDVMAFVVRGDTSMTMQWILLVVVVL